MASPEEIVVRRIKKKDFPQFFRVFRRAFSKEIEIVGLDLQRFFPIVKFYNVIDPISRALETVGVYLPTILVAVSQDDVIIGGVHIAPFGNKVWTIDSLVVDPGYRRLGIGVRLIGEAVKYVWNGRGERALTYVRADNLPSLRIRRKLHGEFFDERVLLLSELNEPLTIEDRGNFSIREVKSKDLPQILELCRKIDSKKAAAFRMTAEKFQYSALERLLGKLGLAFSKRLILEAEDQIAGYIHLTCASPKEAAKIESFYVIGNSDLHHRTTLLLGSAFHVLRERNIKKVTVSLSEDWKEMERVLESIGFKPYASFRGVAHNIT